MSVDEQARHRLYRRLEEVLGPDEAAILMDHLPPRGFGDLATKGDLELLRAATKSDIESMKADIDSLGSRMETLEHRLIGQMDRAVRRVVQWTSSTVLVGIGLAIAAGRLV